MKGIIKEYLPYVIAIILIIIIKVYVVSPVRVNGHSMDPTLSNNDIMILNKIAYKFDKIKRFDIVVIKKEDGTDIIKRVIGLPGDKVEYKDNQLYINGKAVKEEFLHAETEDLDTEKFDRLTVPKNSYYVLGDNRKNSVDSRYLGFIPKKEIEGRANYIIYPFKRFGKVK